jgi:hypothetical protein
MERQEEQSNLAQVFGLSAAGVFLPIPFLLLLWLGAGVIAECPSTSCINADLGLAVVFLLSGPIGLLTIGLVLAVAPIGWGRALYLATQAHRSAWTWALLLAGLTPIIALSAIIGQLLPDTDWLPLAALALGCAPAAAAGIVGAIAMSWRENWGAAIVALLGVVTLLGAVLAVGLLRWMGAFLFYLLFEGRMADVPAPSALLGAVGYAALVVGQSLALAAFGYVLASGRDLPTQTSSSLLPSQSEPVALIAQDAGAFRRQVEAQLSAATRGRLHLTFGAAIPPVAFFAADTSLQGQFGCAEIDPVSGVCTMWLLSFPDQRRVVSHADEWALLEAIDAWRDTRRQPVARPQPLSADLQAPDQDAHPPLP